MPLSIEEMLFKGEVYKVINLMQMLIVALMSLQEMKSNPKEIRDGKMSKTKLENMILLKKETFIWILHN